MRSTSILMPQESRLREPSELGDKSTLINEHG